MRRYKCEFVQNANHFEKKRIVHQALCMSIANDKLTICPNIWTTAVTCEFVSTKRRWKIKHVRFWQIKAIKLRRPNDLGRKKEQMFVCLTDVEAKKLSSNLVVWYTHESTFKIAKPHQNVIRKLTNSILWFDIVWWFLKVWTAIGLKSYRRNERTIADREYKYNQ